MKMSVFSLILAAAALIPPSSPLNLYPYRMDPQEHPDFTRYPVVHPTVAEVGQTPQFATLRSLRVTNKSINFTQVLEKYCLNPNTTLGGIIWPRDPGFMFAENYKDFVDTVKSKGLSITSVHGFSPVSPGYYPPQEVLRYLEETLGWRWYGMANGEQDGHYFGSFLVDALPSNMKPVDQYLNFREYFQKMEAILGPKMTTLLSSTFPHYQLKTGLYTTAGAETSQHGPNAQLRYAFIRGAGKQYGVLWFGNVSVYNRFGHKVYTSSTGRPRERASSRKDAGKGKTSAKRNKRLQYSCVRMEANPQPPGLEDPFGPTCGTSLNLMKRLMYAQMMYNSIYVSFEGGWFTNSDRSDVLSPIGLVQHNAYLWSRKHPDLGTHVATVGLYLDFFSGWTAPRLKESVYRMWSHLPYGPADYLTDGVVRMVYPAYQDSSYFHDETGVSSPTPYGDALDVLLSDTPPWLLRRYNTIVLSGEMHANLLEVASNLEEYVLGGGNLLVTVGNLGKFPNGLLNITADTASCRAVRGGSKFHLMGDSSTYVEKYNMSVCNIKASDSVLARSVHTASLVDTDQPLAWTVPFENSGTLTILATPFGVSHDQVTAPASDLDQSLASPYPLLTHVGLLVDRMLTNATLVTSESRNLSVVTNHLSDDQYMVLVSNPFMEEQPLGLVSPNAPILDTREVPLDQSEKAQTGYLPDGFEGTDLGRSTDVTIAGVDTRLFEVRLAPRGSIRNIPRLAPKARPKGLALHLRHPEHSIRQSILLRPTFFQHYDSVVVDYAYFSSKEQTFLSSEGEWLRQQGVRLYVDASPSINLFPGLKLTNDTPDGTNGVDPLLHLLEKMAVMKAHDLVISLHILPSGQSRPESELQVNTSLHLLANSAGQRNITLHMLDTPKNPFSLLSTSRWLQEIGLDSSMKFVLNLASLIQYGINYKYDEIIQSRSDLLYVNALGKDPFGTNYTLNSPISKASPASRKGVATMVSHICTLRRCPYGETNAGTDLVSGGGRDSHGSDKVFYPFVMDAAFAGLDEEYWDIHWIENLLLQPT